MSKTLKTTMLIILLIAIGIVLYCLQTQKPVYTSTPNIAVNNPGAKTDFCRIPQFKEPIVADGYGWIDKITKKGSDYFVTFGLGKFIWDKTQPDGYRTEDLNKLIELKLTQSSTITLLSDALTMLADSGIVEQINSGPNYEYCKTFSFIKVIEKAETIKFDLAKRLRESGGFHFNQTNGVLDETWEQYVP